MVSQNTYLEFAYKLRPIKGYDLKVNYTMICPFSKKDLEMSVEKVRRCILFHAIKSNTPDVNTSRTERNSIRLTLDSRLCGGVSTGALTSCLVKRRCGFRCNGPMGRLKRWKYTATSVEVSYWLMQCSQFSSLDKNNTLREIKLRLSYLQGKSTAMSVIAHQTEKEWISANEKNRQRMAQTHADGAAEQHVAKLEDAHLRAHIISVLQHQKDINQKQHICVKHDFVDKAWNERVQQALKQCSDFTNMIKDKIMEIEFVHSDEQTCRYLTLKLHTHTYLAGTLKNNIEYLQREQTFYDSDKEIFQTFEDRKEAEQKELDTTLAEDHENIKADHYVIEESKIIKAVIKGLPASTDVTDIESELKAKGMAVENVAQLRRFSTKAPLPLFIEIKRSVRAEKYTTSKT
ncbi:uncharacterized protein TNCV_1619271 [Trichonephila clavipes]|nr:uncharacterized protein TNCV_1619271 [Trichonephila clavipes]